ncbi:ABC transporter permease, partial [Bacteroidota bacterium]
LGNMMERGLTSSRIFSLVKEIDSVPITDAYANELVRNGDFQIAIIFPENTSNRIRAKIRLMVAKTMNSISMMSDDLLTGVTNRDSVEITILFDPAVKKTFQNAFLSATKEYNAKMESRMVFEIFQEETRKMFPNFTMPVSEFQESVYFTTIYPSGGEEETLPSTTQHNVPSWAIFAMFFVIVPLTSSIIKEREEGSLIRLMTIPVSYMTIFMAKVGVYLIVCMIQFVLMVLAGIFLLPLFDMPPLEVGNNYLGIAFMTIAASLAALGYGIMVGTIAKTHQQAAAFGAVSIVVLAALGGLWVPIYLMGSVMRDVAVISPLNWAHEGFIDLFLRGSTTMDILPEVGKLLIFFAVTVTIAGIYRTIKPPIST